MKKITILMLQLLVIVSPIVYLLIIWNRLPVSVPIHFDSNSIADKFGTKAELLAIIGFIGTVTFVISGFILNIEKIDPKRKYDAPGNLLIKSSWTLTIFLTLINFLALRLSVQYQSEATHSGGKFIFLLVSMFFVAIGNLMNNIKPNYFIGIRTPWTLESEEVWRKTHHIGSKIWFFGGCLLFILLLFIPQAWASKVFITSIMIISLTPIAYSYLIFRKKHDSNVNSGTNKS